VFASLFIRLAFRGLELNLLFAMDVGPDGLRDHLELLILHQYCLTLSKHHAPTCLGRAPCPLFAPYDDDRMAGLLGQNALFLIYLGHEATDKLIGAGTSFRLV
jgi:hypothetical protein